MERKYIKVTDAAEELDVHPDTITRLIHSGELVAVRLAGAYRIDAADFLAFTNRRRRQAIYGLSGGERRAAAQREAEKNPAPPAPKPDADAEHQDFPEWRDVLGGINMAFNGPTIAPLVRHPISGELMTGQQAAVEVAEAAALHKQLSPRRRRTKTAPAPVSEPTMETTDE